MINRFLFRMINLAVLFAASASTEAVDITKTLLPRPTHRAELHGQQVPSNGSVRIVLKFLDGSGIRADRGKFVLKPALMRPDRLSRHAINEVDLRAELSSLNDLVRRSGLSADALIKDDEREHARLQGIAERYWRHEVADLASYMQLVLSDGGNDPRHETLVAQLNAFAIIEIAYIEPIAESFATEIALPKPQNGLCSLKPVPDDLGDFTPLQAYLGKPPMGINALAIHDIPGGRGENVRVIDIEGGMFPHGDLPNLFMTVGEMFYQYGEHGTAVVGVIAAKDNGVGTIGIASEAAVGFRSIYNSNIHGGWLEGWGAANSDSANVASNIYWAAKHSLQGVVLIELQRPGPPQADCPCGSCIATPVEFWPAEFDAIQVAVGNGATVVEAAGNGGRNLDHDVFQGAFDRSTRDSGAILTTGSDSDGVTPLCHHGSPNHGSRIDLHSWANSVVTTGTVTGGHPLLFDSPGSCYDYTQSFSGSSSASAIVAGAATALQGVHRALFGKPADPLSLRKLMADSGTPQMKGTEDLPIGRQPDLLKAVAEMGD